MVLLDLSASALALALRVPADRISDIVRERCGVTTFFGGHCQGITISGQGFHLG